MHKVACLRCFALHACFRGRCDSEHRTLTSGVMLYASWPEAVLERLYKSLFPESPPTEGEHGSVAAHVSTLLDGGTLSALHVFDLVQLSESKSLVRLIGTASKPKVLYKWLHLILGGMAPASYPQGYNKAVTTRILRDSKVGRRAITETYKGSENAEQRQRHLDEWASSMAGVAFLPECLSSSEEAGRAFAQAGAAKEAAASLAPPKAVASRPRRPLGEADAARRASGVRQRATINGSEAAAQLLSLAASDIAARLPASPTAVLQRASYLDEQVTQLKKALQKEEAKGLELHAERLRAEGSLRSAETSARELEQGLRRDVRAVQAKLAAANEEAAAAVAAAEAEQAVVMAREQAKCQRLRRELQEARGVATSQVELGASALSLQRELKLRERELERERGGLQKAKAEERQHNETQHQLRSAQLEVTALRQVAAATMAEAEADAAAALEEKASEHAALLARQHAKSERLKADLRKARDEAAEQSTLAASALSLKRELQLKDRELVRAREGLEQEQDRGNELAEAARRIELEKEMAATQVRMLSEQLHGYRVSNGRAERKLEAQNAAAARAAAQAPTTRQLRMSLGRERQERANLLEVRSELADKIYELEAQVLENGALGRGKRPHPQEADTSQLEVHPLRGKGGHFDGFSLEMFRRLVEECGIPFSAVPTANTLILAMHTRTVPPPEMFLSASTVKNAVMRLGFVDKLRLKQRNQAADKRNPWAPAADAGAHLFHSR